MRPSVMGPPMNHARRHHNFITWLQMEFMIAETPRTGSFEKPRYLTVLVFQFFSEVKSLRTCDYLRTELEGPVILLLEFPVHACFACKPGDCLYDRVKYPSTPAQAGVSLHEDQCCMHKTLRLQIRLGQAIDTHVVDHRDPLLETFMSGPQFHNGLDLSFRHVAPPMEGARWYDNFLSCIPGDLPASIDPGQVPFQDLEGLGVDRVIVRKDPIPRAQLAI